MKALGVFLSACVVSGLLLLVACSGGGTAAGSGVVSVSVTDAKPLLPENVTNVFVEFSGIWVHQPGAGWKELALAKSPAVIDLLQFQEGNTAELVAPVVLESGHYTQMRIAVSSATIRFDNGGKLEDRKLEIPSENLKTDKNFTINVASGAAMDIVIHFDLSQSIVVSGPPSESVYKLKPVLHLFEDPLQAATLEGWIDNSSFEDSEKATIIVTADSNNEEFTSVEISKSAAADTTAFHIFWIVPDQSYTVWIDLDQDGTKDCEEWVEDFYLPEGAVYSLNMEAPIKAGADICRPAN